MRRATVIILLIFLSAAQTLFAQEKGQNITCSGYVNWVYSAIFDSITGPWTNSNMIHNRINLKAYGGNSFIVGAEIRNRAVTGNMVSSNPYYAESLEEDPGWIDMSWNLVDEKGFIFNTMLDRLWVEYNRGNFQLRAGRQRINWSQTMVWNPNDIFNTYSFFDFDYVERPGSDAVQIIYSTTPSSSAEVAVKAEHDGRITAAALYRFSIKGFDVQFITGEMSQEQFVAGTGWSGAIGSYSLRGEASWFKPVDDRTDKSATLMVTIGTDKVFSDSFTAMAQVMYCNKPLQLWNLSQLYYGGMDATKLAFSEITAMAQVTWNPMPLLGLTGSAIWYPDLNGLFAGPALDLSATENLDLSVMWQYFHSTITGLETRLNLGFLRLRYSF